jgi:hypothetical protein
MIKALGYGGDIPAIAATYANQNLPKQYAIIKKGKTTPERVRIEDVPDPKSKWNQAERKEFTAKILTNEWNLSTKEIYEQIESRFNGYESAPQPKPEPNPGVAVRNTKTNHKADNQTVKGQSAFSRTKPPRNK